MPPVGRGQGGLEDRRHVVRVGDGGLAPELGHRHEDRQHQGDDARWPTTAGSMSGRTVPARLPRPQQLGAGLAQLVQRRDLEDAHGDLGLEPGQQPAGQRVVLDRVDQGEDQGVVPTPHVGPVGHVEHGGQALLDDARGVLVDRSEEQGLLVREVRVGHGAADGGIPGDVGDRGGAVPVPPESSDGRREDGPPGLRTLALGRRRLRLPALRLHVVRSHSGQPPCTFRNRGFE